MLELQYRYLLFFLPPNSGKSIIKVQPITLAPNFFINSIEANAVPPVAIKSSTIIHYHSYLQHHYVFQSWLSRTLIRNLG